MTLVVIVLKYQKMLIVMTMDFLTQLSTNKLLATSDNNGVLVQNLISQDIVNQIMTGNMIIVINVSNVFKWMIVRTTDSAMESFTLK